MTRLLLVLTTLLLLGCGGSSGGSSSVTPPADDPGTGQNPPPDDPPPDDPPPDDPPPDDPPPADPPPAVSISTAPVFTSISFSQPVAMRQVPGDDSWWLVVEQGGVVRVFDNDPQVATTSVYLDLTDRVDASGFEMGLLGLDFHPDYPTDPRAYVNYTRSGPVTFVSEFQTANGGSSLDRSTEQPLFMVPQDFSNHNGGNVLFGPDGYLYTALGDGGSANDPNERAQDTTNLLGTMLRLDVDSADSPYGVPPSNPFAGNSLCTMGFAGNDCPEIMAWGLRNPWRFSFDSATGELWLGDVGQRDWEEVDIIETGGNYGWRIREGAHCNPNLDGNENCTTDGFIDPVTEYDRSVGRSITGGYVYRGTAIENLQGSYIFGDFSTGRILRYVEDSQGNGITEELLDTDLGISSFAEGMDGEIYLFDYNTGTIHQIVAAP